MDKEFSELTSYAKQWSQFPVVLALPGVLRNAWFNGLRLPNVSVGRETGFTSYSALGCVCFVDIPKL